MKDEMLNKLIERLEERYGDLQDNGGCFVEGEWLSLKQIYDIIDELDNDFQE